MAEPKTKATNQNPQDYLSTIRPDQKRADGFALLEMFKRATGEKAVMWGPAIVGFGKYHYKSVRSTQEGDWPLVGFSPRKQSLTLYVVTEVKENQENLFDKLGKYKTSKACLYINKLSDVDTTVLEKIVKKSYQYTKKTKT